MRWVLRIALGALAFVGVAVALLVGLPWLAVIGDSFGAKSYRAHLEANRTVLDPKAPTMNLRLAPDDAAAKYILLGEMHGYGAPQKVDLALTRALISETTPRWYLAEMTPREAMAVNLYIAGGEDGPLRAVFDRFAAMQAQWGNREFFDKLTGFRALNADLPASAQIRFIGIDAPRDDETALAAPPTGAGAPDLGDRATAQAINAALDADSASAPDRTRYAAMQAHMTSLAAMPGFDAARFVGLWGLFHASEAPINGAAPLARWLQEERAPYAGAVVTISTLCIGECYNMMPAAALPAPLHGPAGEAYVWLPMDNANPYFMRPKGVGDIARAVGDAPAALFRISGAQTPYADGDRLTRSTGYLTMLQPWDVDGPAAAAMDYLLVFQGSAPLTPWAGGAHDVSGGVGATYPALIDAAAAP